MTHDEQPPEVESKESRDEHPLEEGSEEEELLSLRQVAEALDVSNPTARRLVMSGKLPALKVLMNEQLCWKVRPSSLIAYQEALASEGHAEDSSGSPHLKGTKKGPSSLSEPPSRSPSEGIPLEAHLAALETVKQALERLGQVENRLEEQRRAAQEAQSTMDLAERQKFALEMELRQYQAALAEQSESLAEIRAEKQAAEMRLREITIELPLKIETHRPSFGQRFKSWLGLKDAR